MKKKKKKRIIQSEHEFGRRADDFAFNDETFLFERHAQSDMHFGRRHILY